MTFETDYTSLYNEHSQDVLLEQRFEKWWSDNYKNVNNEDAKLIAFKCFIDQQQTIKKKDEQITHLEKVIEADNNHNDKLEKQVESHRECLSSSREILKGAENEPFFHSSQRGKQYRAMQVNAIKQELAKEF